MLCLGVIRLPSTRQPAISVYTKIPGKVIQREKAWQRCQEGYQAYDVLNECCNLCRLKQRADFLPLKLQLCESPSIRIYGFVKTAFTVIESLARVRTC